MRGLLVMTVLALAASLIVTGVPMAEEEPVFGYIGADGCKMCHKSAKKGDQYGKWLAGPHANAFKTLGTDEAKAAAAAAGLEGNPQELDECLTCHVTGHGADAALLGKKYSVEQGVGCESCHGPGSEYKKKSTMESREASVAAGLVMPTAETCVGCHNEKSPTFDGFDFDEMFAKIAHPYPEAPEAAEGK